jgi:ribosomal protein L11 methyltransferase
MRTWPALHVGRLQPVPTTANMGAGPDVGAGFSRPDVTDLFQAALLDYDVAAIDDNMPDAWRVFFSTAEERDRAHQGIAADFPELAFTTVDVPDEDWVARSQADLRAIRVGNIVVAPPWDVAGSRSAGASALASPMTIVIQPSMGFGTGHHATTRLCLAALQTLDVRGRSAIDVGTGSGVLAIAAGLLGASPVVAIDDDPDAIQSARENVELNPGADVDGRVVDLRTARLPLFDVVLANLTGGLLIQAARPLQDLAGPSGRLILSGFMHHEEAGVLDAFAAFAVVHRAEEEEWLCVTLQRR